MYIYIYVYIYISCINIVYNVIARLAPSWFPNISSLWNIAFIKFRLSWSGLKASLTKWVVSTDASLKNTKPLGVLLQVQDFIPQGIQPHSMRNMRIIVQIADQTTNGYHQIKSCRSCHCMLGESFPNRSSEIIGKCSWRQQTSTWRFWAFRNWDARPYEFYVQGITWSRAQMDKRITAQVSLVPASHLNYLPLKSASQESCATTKKIEIALELVNNSHQSTCTQI